MEKPNNEKITLRKIKKGYIANYNGVIAKGMCPTSAIGNAQRKYEMKETSNQLQIIGADFKKTLETIRE